MAIKLSGNNIVTNAYELQNIASVDITTQGAINNAIVTQSNVLIIYDSADNIVRTLYCAEDTT